MTYRSVCSILVVALISSTALAQNDPPLAGDGYMVKQIPDGWAPTWDGKNTDGEWDVANLQTWGVDGEFPGVNFGGGEEDIHTYAFALMWDPNPETGGIYYFAWADQGLAPYIDSSQGVNFSNNSTSINSYFDPNLDGEASNAEGVGASPDGYQFAFNVAGPDAGDSESTQILQVIDGEAGPNDTADIGVFWEGHVNTRWGNNGASSFASNGDAFRQAVTDAGLTFHLATNGGLEEWTAEAFIPWQVFDACAGGDGGDGDGLCLTLDTDNGAPSAGDAWYFDDARYIAGLDARATWGGTAGGASGGGFAAWPDPTIIFEGADSGPNPDLNGDGKVDAADAGAMFGVWATDGGDSGADLNGDNTVDAADAGILFAAWTGEAPAAGAGEATAAYNTNGLIEISANGVVNAFVESASGALTPGNADAAPAGLLASDNASRVGLTGFGGINVTNWKSQNTPGLAADDLTLVVGPALGVPSVSYGAGTDQFRYIPEPASAGLLAVGLLGLLASRRRS